MPYGTVQADVIGTSVSGSNLGAGNASIMKNRIINGAMVIDQRNAGVSISAIASSTFITDRWAYYTNATAGAFNSGQNLNSATLPTGFTKYLGFQVASTQSPSGSNAYFFGQKIEGFNVADLGWGTANAKTVTLSFLVYTSVTGTHSGNVQNAANNRSYVFSYSVPVANTWTTVSVTIPGDTTGTWATDNTQSLTVYYNLGCGSGIQTTAGSWNASQYIGVTGGVSVVSNASATFYITGVQLEVGSSATGYEYRQYGQELALCQRYYEVFNQNDRGIGGMAAMYASSNNAWWFWFYKVTKRAQPTMALVNGASFSATVGSPSITTDSVGYQSTANGSNSYYISGGTANLPALTASAEL